MTRYLVPATVCHPAGRSRTRLSGYNNEVIVIVLLYSNLKMNSSFYKYCLVPQCKNTSIKTPDKLFIYVPTNQYIRKKWLTLARRSDAHCLSTSTNKRMYFCQDHFDLPNDMLNYSEYHIMGKVSQVRMKPGCIPSKFGCQGDRRKLTNNSPGRSYIKKQRTPIIEECLNKPEESGASSSSRDTPHTSSDYQTVEQNEPEIIYEQKADKLVEVLTTHKYRSKSVQTKMKTVDQALSPKKPSVDVPIWKKRTDNVKKKQFDPFKEYANDSTDDESTEGGAEEKQDDSDEADNSDDDESESSPLISEKVFVKSHDEKSKGPSQAKRPRRDVEDDLYTEEMYEFGKFVAEQLLCLSVEEAKTAQAEIKELLTRLTANKTKKQTKPSTSKAQRKGGKGKASTSANPVSIEPSEATEPVTQPVFAHVNVPGQTEGPSMSQVYIATPAPTGSSSNVNVAGSSRGIGTPIKEFAVVNTGGITASPIGYIVVPAATGAGPSQLRVTKQLGNTLTTSIGSTSTQQSAIAQDPDPGPSNKAFSDETVIKTEPEDPEPMFTHQNIILSSETLDIKFEPET